MTNKEVVNALKALQESISLNKTKIAPELSRHNVMEALQEAVTTISHSLFYDGNIDPIDNSVL